MADNKDVVMTSSGPVPREEFTRLYRDMEGIGFTTDEVGALYYKLQTPHGYEFGSEVDDPTYEIAG